MDNERIKKLLQDLPIAKVVSEVTQSLLKSNVLLQAEPGAGKSTGLPLALLTWGDPTQKIIMLEPRRLAASSVAERLASQLGEPLGKTIGLRMRGQTSVSKATRLEVVTEGVLTRLLQADPTLDGVGLVVFDEFHERSLHADLGLALCLDIQRSVRTDLRLLLMSATLENSRLLDHLGDARSVYCEGRQFPVDIHWLGEERGAVSARVAQVVKKALVEEPGDVLVFLPGVAEIEKTANFLKDQLDQNIVVFRLHSGTDRTTSRAATGLPKPGQRRVILSTNIAETSITIDGVRVVIDAGLERRGTVDSNTGAVKLETVSASQASATQRAGRAGRTAPGSCYRLWTKNAHNRREESWQAEIFRSDLSPLLMECRQWGIKNIDDIPWLDSPPSAAISRAEGLLETFGFIENSRLTERGRQAGRLSVHPRIANMLLWARDHNQLDIACKLAVVLEEGVRRQSDNDLERLLSQPLSKSVKAREKQLNEKMQTQSSGSAPLPVTKADGSASDPSVGILVAQAYPDWIAQRRTTQNKTARSETHFQLACGSGAVINEDQALSQSAWLAIAGLGGSSQQVRIFSASRLNIDELEHWSPELFLPMRRLEWDTRRERVIAEEQIVLGKLVITTHPSSSFSDQDYAVALLAGISHKGLQSLPWTDETREWQTRVQMMASLSVSGAQSHWPDVSDESLLGQLDQWLLPYLSGIRNLKALAQLDMGKILKANIDFNQQKELDQWLPLRYEVPSGSKIKLRYENGRNPVLSVKLQELFGCIENPTIANGSIPLTVELLSPARRPIQITEDLANFWKTSYHDVRKDMAGRYPKHDWPLDPLNATPTSKAKPRSHKRR